MEKREHTLSPIILSRTNPFFSTMDGDDPTATLLETHTPYVASRDRRPKRDAGWARALLVCAALSIVGGAVSAVHW